ncbi:MAG: excinuclease ABC subunit UvrC [Thermodesulfobacteriota bacterium]|nr:excinuclease ABC subunit UvrC [Thermodesulfobacteriota bacterium]
MALTQEIIHTLPKATGVYIMKDAGGGVIYVGKAIDIRGRVRAYLGQDARAYVRYIRDNTEKIDFMLTSNEKEALLLENQLIKGYKPRYNIFLKDDKAYVSIKITTNQVWPGIYITRRVLKDGARYFGPYSSAGATKKTLAAVGRIFPVRRCKDVEFKNRQRPCIYHQIGLCMAPCVKKISKQEYSQTVKDLISFLEGKDKALVADLKIRMGQQADALNFEQASKIRDQISAIGSTLIPQIIVGGTRADIDVFGMYNLHDHVEVAMLRISHGSIIDGHTFTLKDVGIQDKEVLSASLSQFYLNKRGVPPVIYTEIIPDAKETLEQVLSDIRGSKVKINQAKRGRPKKWVAMARENARGRFRGSDVSVLEEIARVFHLSKIPYRMECYDISAIQGAYAVGSMVVFIDGHAEKDLYRRYRIRDISAKDDLAMMEEVLSRRFKGGEVRPDLIVIDGGKGQLNICMKVFKNLGITTIPVVAMAKERGGRLDRFFLPGRKNPIFLSSRSKALQVLQHLRDEAHRFAITYHRKVRSKASKKSLLEDISGIGNKKATIILKHIGHINIYDIKEEAIIGCKGITKRDVKNIISYIRTLMPAGGRKG